MFSRLTNAVEVLKAPVERVHPAYPPGVYVVPTEEEMEELRTGKPRAWNPLLRFIEGLFIVSLVTYAGFPLLSKLFKAPESASVGASLLGFAMAYLVRSVEAHLHGALGSIVRLDFLDPFIGNRVKEAIEVFRDDDQNDEEGDGGEEYDLGS